MALWLSKARRREEGDLLSTINVKYYPPLHTIAPSGGELVSLSGGGGGGGEGSVTGGDEGSVTGGGGCRSWLSPHYT